MAALTKSGTPSVTTLVYGPEHQIDGLVAGEDIAAGDACYIKAADGKVYRSSGAAANEAASVDGFAAMTARAGKPITLVFGVVLAYGAGLPKGTRYYLSGTVAGGLDTVASVGGTKPVAQAVSATEILVWRSAY
jgi:hypothetical protein